MSTFENYPIYSFKNTLSLLKYFWICIKLMKLKKKIRIFSVGFNGNNTINYFTNNGVQVLKQKLAIAII
jgi:cell division GTPase FtsZ